jgi:hypothetical protein
MILRRPIRMYDVIERNCFTSISLLHAAERRRPGVATVEYVTWTAIVMTAAVLPCSA